MRLKNLNTDFLDEVEKFYNQSLKKKDHLNIIFNVCNKDNKLDKFESLSFTGKYVNGLFKVLQNSPGLPEVESVEHIKKDLSENIEKVTSLLKEITFAMNDKEKTLIEESYLQINQTSLVNIKQLVEDLDIIKKYLNQLKRK